MILQSYHWWYCSNFSVTSIVKSLQTGSRDTWAQERCSTWSPKAHDHPNHIDHTDYISHTDPLDHSPLIT